MTATKPQMTSTKSSQSPYTVPPMPQNYEFSHTDQVINNAILLKKSNAISPYQCKFVLDELTKNPHRVNDGAGIINNILSEYNTNNSRKGK